MNPSYRAILTEAELNSKELGTAKGLRTKNMKAFNLFVNVCKRINGF